MNLRIVTDSTCDLPEEIIARYEIQVVPLFIHMGSETHLDGVDISKDEFYRRLPDYDPAPKTAAPGPETFRAIYERLADEGAQAILSIHISESLSATIASARAAAAEFTRIPVTVLDSTQLSLGLGFIVERAAKMAELGHKGDAILANLTDLMKRTYVFASLKTLEYLRRSGRMHVAVARFGEFLSLKALLHMHMGSPSAHRTRTQKRATARLLTWLAEYAPYERLAIVHAGVRDEAEALLQQVKQFLPEGDVPIVQITPVLGAHLGIGALGFAVVSKE